MRVLPSIAPAAAYTPAVTEPLPFLARLWLAWVVFIKVLFDGMLAQRIQQSLNRLPPLPPVTTPEPARREEEAASSKHSEKRPASPPNPEPALQLLALLQREGRFIDFLQQDLASYRDEQVGSVARVVHQGCRKALLAHANILPIRHESEGARVVIDEDSLTAELKLTGNLQGAAPYRGVLRHRGWRADSVRLPVALPGHDATVLAPAEVEL